MKELKIQTLHPGPGKKNKPVTAETYQLVKPALLKILQYTERTHTQLMNELARVLKGRFTGNNSWYGMTVKLDLEAR